MPSDIKAFDKSVKDNYIVMRWRTWWKFWRRKWLTNVMRVREFWRKRIAFVVPNSCYPHLLLALFLVSSDLSGLFIEFESFRFEVILRIGLCCANYSGRLGAGCGMVLWALGSARGYKDANGLSHTGIKEIFMLWHITGFLQRFQIIAGGNSFYRW